MSILKNITPELLKEYLDTQFVMSGEYSIDTNNEALIITIQNTKLEYTYDNKFIFDVMSGILEHAKQLSLKNYVNLCYSVSGTIDKIIEDIVFVDKEDLALLDSVYPNMGYVNSVMDSIKLSLLEPETKIVRVKNVNQATIDVTSHILKKLQYDAKWSNENNEIILGVTLR